MKLKLTQALDYVKEVGFQMSERTSYRQKRKVQEMKLERMHHIAKVAYEEQHLERLDRMELIENLMWLNYFHEKSPSKKVKILSEIVNIQPFISSYYEATKYLVDTQEAKIKGEKDYQEWCRSHPRPTYDPLLDLGLPQKTEEEVSEFKKKWGLDKVEK